MTPENWHTENIVKIAYNLPNNRNHILLFLVYSKEVSFPTNIQTHRNRLYRLGK